MQGLHLDGRDSGARVDRVTQEHGEVELPADADLDAWRVGARVRILANHSCLTAAQHAEYHVVEGGDVWRHGAWRGAGEAGRSPVVQTCRRPRSR